MIEGVEMLLNDTQVGEIIDRLVIKCSDIDWRLEEHRYVLDLSDKLRIELSELTTTEGTAFLFLVYAGKARIAEVAADNSDARHASLKLLYEAATSRVGSEIHKEILTALSLSEPVVNRTKPPVTTAGVTSMLWVQPNEASDFLASIQGGWRLDYGRGQEDVEISHDGIYSVKRLDGSYRPVFQLIVVAIDPIGKRVELGKERLSDRTRYQNEVLSFAQRDTLIGEAKHDLHKLVYVRTPPSTTQAASSKVPPKPIQK